MVLGLISRVLLYFSGDFILFELEVTRYLLLVFLVLFSVKIFCDVPKEDILLSLLDLI